MKMKNSETKWIEWWSKFIMIIGLGGKSSLKNKHKQYSKWRRIWRAYKNPILEFDVEQMKSKNKGNFYRAHVVSTTRGGTAWNMD
jgi:hypothetical protein